MILLWAKLQLRQQIALFSICIIMIGYLFYLLLLQAQWIRLSELTTEYNRKKQQVADIETFVLAHPNQELYLLELSRNLAILNNALPDHLDSSGFLVKIEQLSQECNVQFHHFKPIKIVNKENYQVFEFEFEVTGNFIENLNFINKLEKQVRFITINVISIQLHQNTLISKLSAKIYSYGLPASSIDAKGKAIENKK